MSAATESGGDPAASAAHPCANCGHPRNARFCPKCGQNDRDYIRSLPPLLGDILKETFELDSRIRRTLPPLFLRPGELPAEFSRNRRARYMSPVRLYLFTSILFFFLLSLDDFRPRRLDREALQERGPAAVRVEIDKARATDTAALKALLPPSQQRKVDEIIARPGMVGPKAAIVGLATYVEEDASSDAAAWKRYVLARAVDVAADPAAVFSQFVQNLPLAMFVTLPAYALLLMLFFFGSHRFFTEHLVFAVQMHTFAFIVLAVSMLLPEDGPGRGPDGPHDRADIPAIAAVQAARNDALGAGAAAIPEAPAAAPSERSNRDPLEAPPAAQAVADVPASEGEDASERELRESRIKLGPDDDGWDVFDVLELLLFLWLLAYHYLALRRYYGNGRVRTAIKWAVLTSAYCVLLIPGMALSAVFTVFQLR